jgi:hypothetical protein
MEIKYTVKVLTTISIAVSSEEEAARVHATMDKEQLAINLDVKPGDIKSWNKQ